MIDQVDSDARALRRMLANGPLAAVPKRPADQDLLVRLAAATLEPGRDYSERELNDRLEAWLATFVEPYGIDHVTLRRMLVDSRLIERTSSGSSYRLDAAKAATVEALRGVKPEQVLDEVRAEREARKKRSAEGGHA